MHLRRWFPWSKGRRGQNFTEYALVLGMIAIVCIAAFSATGSGVNGLLQAVADSLSTIGE